MSSASITSRYSQYSLSVWNHSRVFRRLRRLPFSILKRPSFQISSASDSSVRTTFESGNSSKLLGFYIFRSHATVRTPSSVIFLITGIGCNGLQGPRAVVVTGLYFFSFIFITGASLGFSFTGWILGVSTVFLGKTVIVKRVVRVSE